MVSLYGEASGDEMHLDHDVIAAARQLRVSNAPSGIFKMVLMIRVIGDHPIKAATLAQLLATHSYKLNYSVQELECLAIVYSVKKFRHYLLGSPFEIEVMSDHQSLQYLKKGREAGGRIARWAMALSEHNYQIEYLPGKSNLLGNALSRLVAIEKEHIAKKTRPRQTAELAPLFPEVHSEIAWQASQGLPELESSSNEDNANEIFHFSDRDIDFSEFGYGQYEAEHESILYYQANVQQTSTSTSRSIILTSRHNIYINCAPIKTAGKSRFIRGSLLIRTLQGSQQVDLWVRIRGTPFPHIHTYILEYYRTRPVHGVHSCRSWICLSSSWIP
jgi:hypothetical protein